MNNREFLKELEKKTNYDKDMCLKINNIFKRYMLIGRKNKERIINDLEEELNLTSSDANKLYEIFMSIITIEVKNKLKHPFKNLDK